ncbi:ionotropic receptor [Plakobranchus ocellatus]|uniref:Ionotropic receptor n=1 Tax=Plakobranchus ocellatus TaxID=259542 RepID=A0AAV4CCL4_9GAST|nr:ionotropic receptor [Plakobranchus ocellatus]
MGSWKFLLIVFFIVVSKVISVPLEDSVSPKFASQSKGYNLSNSSHFAFPQFDENAGNKTLHSMAFRKTQKWTRLFQVAWEVMDYTFDLHEKNNGSNLVKVQTFLYIYTAELPMVMHKADTSLAISNQKTKSIIFEANNLYSRNEVQRILLAALDKEMAINGVVVASSNADFVTLVLDTVATESIFKWRRFLHTTEWIALIVDTSSSHHELFRKTRVPDFVTLIFIEEEDGILELNVTQKSRTKPFDPDPQLSVNLKTPPFDKLQATVLSSFSLSKLSKYLRKNAASFLSTQKSAMADMVIPTVFLEAELDKTWCTVTDGNTTTWKGFSVDVMNLLSEALGFTVLPFAVSDGGFYGLYGPSGNMLGVTGYLSRREAALTSMAMFYASQRLEHVDYLFPSIDEGTNYIMYRVESHRIQLGDFYSVFVKRKRDLFNLLICISVALITGVTVFIVNGGLANRRNILRRKNLWRLYDFPFHCVFQTSELYWRRSGRILRASWGLFCVIMFASFGALLTSDATAPVERPVISSLEDLISYPDLVIGISPTCSKLITDMSTAEPGTKLARIWHRLVMANQSEDRTFSSDDRYHVRRVLQGGYAYITDTATGLLQSFLDVDYNQVRFSEIMHDQLYMTMPRNAFYKYDIERVLLAARESGIIKPILDRWVPPDVKMKTSEVDKQTVVHFSRLKVLFILIASGIGSAILSLVVEKLLHLRNRVQQESSAFCFPTP